MGTFRDTTTTMPTEKNGGLYRLPVSNHREPVRNTIYIISCGHGRARARCVVPTSKSQRFFFFFKCRPNECDGSEFNPFSSIRQQYTRCITVESPREKTQNTAYSVRPIVCFNNDIIKLQVYLTRRFRRKRSR